MGDGLSFLMIFLYAGFILVTSVILIYLNTKVANKKLGPLYNKIYKKDANNTASNLGDNRQIRTFGKSIHHLIPLGEESIHRIDFFNEKNLKNL